MRSYTIIAVAFLSSTPMANAQEQATIHTNARNAVAANRIEKSQMVGFGIVRSSFRDVPTDGSVLIGFEAEVSKFTDHEVVQTLAPIYLTERGDLATNSIGTFKNPNKRNPTLTRRLRASAPDGYAVGAIELRTGLFIDGVRLHYYRIKGDRLDANDAQYSDWLGNDLGGSERILGGSGAPIVGVHGNRDEQRVLALGIYQVSRFVTPAKLEPKNKGWAKPAPEPEPQPRPQPAPQIVKEPAVEPAEAEVPGDAVEAPEAPVAKQQQETPSSMWIPLGMIGFVGAMLFFGGWLVMDSKRRNDPTLKPTSKKKPRTTPPPLPKDWDETPTSAPPLPPPLPPAVDPTRATGVSEKAPLPKLPPLPKPKGSLEL